MGTTRSFPPLPIIRSIPSVAPFAGKSAQFRFSASLIRRPHPYSRVSSAQSRSPSHGACCRLAASSSACLTSILASGRGRGAVRFGEFKSSIAGLCSLPVLSSQRKKLFTPESERARLAALCPLAATADSQALKSVRVAEERLLRQTSLALYSHMNLQNAQRSARYACLVFSASFRS